MDFNAWSEADKAVDLLKLLEVESGDQQLPQEDASDVKKDLRKLIKLLENPIFRQNLNMQQSMRSLNRTKLQDGAPSISGQTDNGSWSRPASMATASGSNFGKHVLEAATLIDESTNREVHKITLTVDNECNELGLVLLDEGGSVFVAEVSPNGLIARDGLIEPGDELLVVDGRPVAGGGLTSKQVTELLKSKIARSRSSFAPSVTNVGFVRKNGNYDDIDLSTPAFVQLEFVLAKRQRRRHSFNFTSNSPSRASASYCPRRATVDFGENNMVLHGEWTQIQVVELENDGSGLGFGIVGGRSTGVVVKTILAGGAADKDGRLRPGDHLLMINDVHLHGMSSEQVAMILRQQDQPIVKIVVGRPADVTSPHPSHSSYQDPDFEGKQIDNRGAFTAPTKVASDPVLLDQHIQQMNEVWASEKTESALVHAELPVVEPPPVLMQSDDQIIENAPSIAPPASARVDPRKSLTKDELKVLTASTFSRTNRCSDEYETFDVTLQRDGKTGLGIAVACYAHLKEEISGLFVRSIAPGSVADVDGRVQPHDQIIKVNENNVDDARSHREAVQFLAESGDVVRLTLIRYHFSSLKYRFLEMLASQDPERQIIDLHANSSAAPVATTSLSSPPRSTDIMSSKAANFNASPSNKTFVSANVMGEQKRDSLTTHDDEEALKKKWRSELGSDYEVMVARIDRSGARDNGAVQSHFGIALEGTVDVVNGTELRPHHYVRSVSPDSAAAACGRLRAGDELLEANGQRLYGQGYLEVVDILRQLSASTEVRLVCARRTLVTTANVYEPSTSDSLQRNTTASFAQPPTASSVHDRLVKAKSEVSLFQTTATTGDSSELLLTDRLLTEVADRLRSRSLEPLTNLAVWSTNITAVELTKGDRGLGFSVLDYQDPLHPSETVIVIRALVPGGAASADGRLVPGDRLLFVNDVDLSVNATLEKAVDALKGASKGVVRLGVAKPLPLLDEAIHSPIITQTERLLAKGSVSSPQPNRKWSNTERQSNRHRHTSEAVDDETGGAPPPLPLLPPPDWTLEARRRLYPESYLSMSSWSGGSSPSLSPAGSPSLLRGSWAADIIHLPPHLEQSVKMKKGGTDQLGVTVEAVDKAVNGCLVKNMLRSGAFAKDGRVRVGDFVVRMNNENLRNVTNSQARAVLKRTNLLGTTDFNVSYIPSQEAEKYRDYVAKQQPPESPVQNINRLSPKSPYVPRRGPLSQGESEASSDAEMSAKDHEQPLSPAAASTFSHPPTVDSYGSSQTRHDAASAVSSASTAPVSVDYAHYPVSGDQCPASSYDATPSPLSHEFRPIGFAEALPTVAEVPESKMSSPDRDSDLVAGQSPTMSSPSPPPPPVLAIQEDLRVMEPVDVQKEESVSIEKEEVTVIEREPSSQQDQAVLETSEEKNTVTISSEPPVVVTENALAAPQQPASSKPPDSPSTSSAATTSSVLVRSKYWGEPRTVELTREPGRSLGISIVGGRVEVSKGAPGTGTTVSGIFIKSVIAQSAAGRCGQLNMGDRILSVNGVDLKEATHEQAVEVIRNAANPVRFVVQSLHSIPAPASCSVPNSPGGKLLATTPTLSDGSERKSTLSLNEETRNAVQQEADAVFTFDESKKAEESTKIEPMKKAETPPAVVEASVVVVEGTADRTRNAVAAEEDDEMEKSERFDQFTSDQPSGSFSHSALARRPSEPINEPTFSSSDDHKRRYSAVEQRAKPQTAQHPQQQKIKQEDHHHFNYRGRVDSSSAGAMRKIEDDSEAEDEFGYTQKKIKTKYADLKGDVVLIEFDKGAQGLGLSLAGHRDRSKLSVFVVGVQPDSPAVVGEQKVVIGDELLEINGIVLHGRSHLNASAIIKTVHDSKVTLIVRRRLGSIDDMAITPIQYNASMQRWLPTSGGPSSPRASAKTSVTGTMSVDITHATSNDKRKESVERSTSVAGTHYGKASSSGAQTTSLTTEQTNFSVPRNVKVRKGAVGFGITLTDGTTDGHVRGIFITHISPDSPSAQDKSLRIGDQVLAVNGRPVNDMTSNNVADLIHDCVEVELTVSSHTIVPLPHSPATAAKRASNLTATEGAVVQRKLSGASSPNLISNQIVAGHETYIEIEKCGKGLGLSIVGGTDTVLGSVVIHEVYPDGAAAKDARLQPGDQVLEVNGQSLREVAHETAINILRQTPSKVRLLVYRDPNLQLSLLDPTQIYNIFDVELIKKPGKGLGLSIVGRKTEPGVFISEVVKGGVADADGRLTQGDQILAVNGQDLTNAMQEQAATILKTCMGKVSLKVGRWKLSGNNPSPNFPVSKILAPSGAISPTVPAISIHQAKPTVVTVEDTTVVQRQLSRTHSPVMPSQPIDVHVSEIRSEKSLTNGDHCDSKTLQATTPTVDTKSVSDMFLPPPSSPALMKKESTSSMESTASAVATIPTGKTTQPSTSSGSDETKAEVPILDISEEGCETVMAELYRVPDRPLGMGIGKRPRGILVTSVQPGTPAAEKLKVGDRILAVNGHVVTDQQSAVSYVKASQTKVVLQLARPRPECIDLATGHIRSPLTTIVTLQRGPEGFGFSIVGGATDGDEGSGENRKTRKPAPIYISNVYKNGPAATDGRLKVGDQLLEVGGRSVRESTHAEAVRLIKDSKPTITLTIISNPKHKRRNS